MLRELSLEIVSDAVTIKKLEKETARLHRLYHEGIVSSYDFCCLRDPDVATDSLPGLQEDSNKINQVRASLVGGVQGKLEEIWVSYGILHRTLGRVDSAIINFSMEKAREQAWSVALTKSGRSGA